MKFAVIDIGSNSVRLMVWANGKSYYKRVCTTRLGADTQNGLLSQPRMIASAEAIQRFVQEGREEGCEMFYAFATAAVRYAQNRQTFLDLVKSLCGIDVDVVSGEEEALLGLKGALGQNDGGICDIGGASTEVCVQQNEKIIFSESLKVGAVSLYRDCGDDKEKLLKVITASLLPLSRLQFSGFLTAIGGTATTLGCLKLGLESYDCNLIQDLLLTKDDLSNLCKLLFSRSLEERKALKGMDVRRADIICGGALLLKEVVNKIGAEGVVLSDRDNLEGYLYQKALI